MSELYLVIFSLTWLGAWLVVPAVIAIFKGIKWWREINRSGPCPRIRILEVVLFLIALVPGLFFVFLLDTDEMVLIPLGILISLGMGSGALLGWLYAHATIRAYSMTRVRTPSSPAGTMVAGVLLAAVWSFVFLLVVPGLLPSRIVSHEFAAIARLRAYLGAQEYFRKEDRYGIGRKVYANPKDGSGFPDLYELGGPGLGGRRLKLTDRASAEATDPEHAKAGYWSADIIADASGPYDYTKQHGLCAVPAQYNRTGRCVFIIDASGLVFMKDAAARTGDACEPVTVWPDLERDGWSPVGD